MTHIHLSAEQDSMDKRAPITVKYEIPYFTVSGIQVRYLKIVEKSGYQALPWVRYITQNGDDYRSAFLSLSTNDQMTDIICIACGLHTRRVAHLSHRYDSCKFGCLYLSIFSCLLVFLISRNAFNRWRKKKKSQIHI